MLGSTARLGFSSRCSRWTEDPGVPVGLGGPTLPTRLAWAARRRRAGGPRRPSTTRLAWAACPADPIGVGGPPPSSRLSGRGSGGYTAEAPSGCSAAWQRATFGTWRPRVQIPASRQSGDPQRPGGLSLFESGSTGCARPALASLVGGFDRAGRALVVLR